MRGMGFLSDPLVILFTFLSVNPLSWRSSFISSVSMPSGMRRITKKLNETKQQIVAVNWACALWSDESRLGYFFSVGRCWQDTKSNTRRPYVR